MWFDNGGFLNIQLQSYSNQFYHFSIFSIQASEDEPMPLADAIAAPADLGAPGGEVPTEALESCLKSLQKIKNCW